MKQLNPCAPDTVSNVLDGLGIVPRAVLDVGCGRADTLKALHTRFAGARLCGMEADADHAKAAKENCPEAEIIHAPVQTLARGDFDVIVCECSFSLFSEPSETAEKLFSALCPGGLLILSDLFLPTGGATSFADRSATLGVLYPREELENMIKNAGFHPVQFEDRSADMVHMAAQMIFDGSFCSCISPQVWLELKRLGARYGLWTFAKEAQENEP